MKRIFTAIVAAILLAAMPAQATTFPSLTLIYTAVGFADSDNTPVSVGTTVMCANQSGQNATVRWRFLTLAGTDLGLQTLTVPNGQTISVGTPNGTVTNTDNFSVSAASNTTGRLAIYSTQSAVFCNAVVARSDQEDAGNSLPMVRFNAHPGTVE